MTTLGIILTIIALLALVGIKIMRNMFEGKLDKMRANAQRKIRRGEMDNEDADQLIDAERFWVPTWGSKALIGIIVFGILLSSFNGLFFYAEPTYKYHIRPIWGGESVVSGETGYRVKGFGRVNDWKIAMSVLSDSQGGMDLDDVSSAEDSANISARLPVQRIIFLDQVDAKASATVRFRLPDDETEFLRLVHDFRSPENFLNTELIPAFKETLKATSSLMSAEEYFSGGRTEFISEFDDQMNNGVYKVKRIQVTASDPTDARQGSADASAVKQDNYEDDGKVVFKVEKQIDWKTKEPLRKVQKFKGYGVTIVSARILDMVPNEDFQKRMKAKQTASAQRAVNREERIQEEEQKFLAIAKGEREIAEEQAAARKFQMKETTNAETTKRLVLIKATQQKEQARIEKETAQIQLEKAEIDAKKKERLADAEAYEKQKLLMADNALKVKLEALVKMNADTMKALSVRPVPNMMIMNGAGAGGEAAAGVSSDIQNIAATQMLKNLKALDLDMNIGAPAKQ